MILFLSILLVLASLFIIYLSTKNIFSFPFITWLLLFSTFIGCILITRPPYYPLVFYFSLGVASFTLGIIFANLLKKFSPSRELNKFRNLQLFSPFKFNFPFFAAFIILLILNFFAIGYLFTTQGIPFFQPNIETAKIDITSGSNWLLLRTLRIFLPVLISILFLYMLKTGKFITKLLFIALIFIMAVIYLFYGFKGYFLSYLFLPLLTLWVLVKKISAVKLILLIILVLTVTLPLVCKMINSSNPILVSKVIFERFTIGKAEGISYIVNTLVPEEGFFYGSTFKMDIAGIFYKIGLSKEPAYPFNTYLVDRLKGFSTGGRIQTDSILFGDFYVNFGLLGGIVGTFLAGFILQFLYIRTLRSSKNIFFLPLYISFQAALSGAIVAGKTLITLVDMGFMTLFILFILLIGYALLSLPSGKVPFLKKISS